MPMMKQMPLLLLLLLFNLLILQIRGNEDSDKAVVIERPVQRNGVWMNKAQVYSKCHLPHYERRQCANFSLIQRPVTRSRVLRPECAFLMQRLACSLYKLNCHAHQEFSFQMYDIPCQSSCHATVDICNRQRLAAATSTSQSPQQHWQTYPKRSAPLFIFNTPPPPPSSTSNMHYRSTLGLGGVAPSWQRATPQTSQSVWPWRPYVSSDPLRRMLRSPGESDEEKWPVLKHEDCRFLPSGGCDDWARRLVKHHRYYNRDYASETRQNPGCPKDFAQICEKMFPMKFEKEDWERGNYTIALMIKISQTFWWFGKFDRFQPFFRFNVKRTLKSDIVEYDDKVILTNAWPSPCVCPNKLVVGKKYLLLTHSRLSRQTLRISTDSVFLEKPKKYSRLIQCWMGTCPRQVPRNRAYGRDLWNWQWHRLKRNRQ